MEEEGGVAAEGIGEEGGISGEGVEEEGEITGEDKEEVGGVADGSEDKDEASVTEREAEEKAPIHITDEPAVGWKRFEVEGKKPYYKSPPPRTAIHHPAALLEYLLTERSSGRVSAEMFSFKRRHGLKRRKVETEVKEGRLKRSKASAVAVAADPVSEAVKQLSRDPNIKLEHKKELQKAASNIDGFRSKQCYETPSDFQEIREKLGKAEDMRSLCRILLEESATNDAITALYSDVCIAEIAQISSTVGPLVQFPPSVNANLYADICNYGMEKCPKTIMFAIRKVVRPGEAVLPSAVPRISTLFSTIIYAANRTIDSAVKVRSLTMQMDGLSNEGINILHDVGLAQCARALSHHKDLFAEVGPMVMEASGVKNPWSSLLDNCDVMGEHLTVEVVEKETVDTSHLGTEPQMTKAEALEEMNKYMIMMGEEQHQMEREHLKHIITLAGAAAVGELRPDFKAKVGKFIPAHHKHEHSWRKLSAALTFIKKPYPYQETKNPDTIKLLIRIQRSFLQSVAGSREDEVEFRGLLELLEDPNAEEEKRKAAEMTVHNAVKLYGEWIGHGDLLTVKMVQEAKMLMAGSATAFGTFLLFGAL